MNQTYLPAALLMALIVPAIAEEPVLQSPSPVIYLADNLDEAEKLGWCIDTLGRGWSEEVQAHSCKPQGGDTQFRFDAGAIRSVEFEGKCVTLSAPDNPAVPFGLFDCDPGAGSQSFAYDDASMELRLASDASRCVVVAEASRTAGPFMSRDLTVKSCADVDAGFKQWIIRE